MSKKTLKTNVGSDFELRMQSVEEVNSKLWVKF